nr:MAG TPA: D-Ala-teichoic acid biosynthesis protein [Caudoviricetes sp.]
MHIILFIVFYFIIIIAKLYIFNLINSKTCKFI